MQEWYHLSEEDKQRIEKAINRPGRSETTLKLEKNNPIGKKELFVMAVEKKKIS